MRAAREQAADAVASAERNDEILTAQELLAGSLLVHDVAVPAAVLRPGGAPDADVGKVRLRPLKVATLALISKASREDPSLVPLLMIKESLVEPALALEQIRQMHAGLLHFLVAAINRISGLDADGERGARRRDIGDRRNAPAACASLRLDARAGRRAHARPGRGLSRRHRAAARPGRRTEARKVNLPWDQEAGKALRAAQAVLAPADVAWFEAAHAPAFLDPAAAMERIFGQLLGGDAEPAANADHRARVRSSDAPARASCRSARADAESAAGRRFRPRPRAASRAIRLRVRISVRPLRPVARDEPDPFSPTIAVTRR